MHLFRPLICGNACYLSHGNHQDKYSNSCKVSSAFTARHPVSGINIQNEIDRTSSKQCWSDYHSYLYRELHCVPDVWSLGEWSNWLTPPDLEKRFDTAFFICMVNGEPPVQHDETETTHSEVSRIPGEGGIGTAIWKCWGCSLGIFYSTPKTY